MLFKMRCLGFMSSFHRGLHSLKSIPKSGYWPLNNIAKDLDNIERNVLVRHHKNNVPLIRSLIEQIENGCENEYTLREQLQMEFEKLPNATHPRVLNYGDVPLELKQFQSKQFEKVKEFSEICKQMNLLRMDHLGNFTGHKSYYLYGGLAALEQALIRYTLTSLKEKNFELISVPDILPTSTIEGCGMQTQGERTQVYKLETGDCLSGTAEMALAGFFANKLLDEENLPIKVAAVSRCYRAETSGLHEEKGIYRVHQFTKVEMFAVCAETQSELTLESFKDIEISLFKNLGLNFKLLDMPPSDLGAPAYQKYDIEAWMPGRQMWGEISSCSNCTDYQAKRLNIKYRAKNGEIKFAHTVNGTAGAIPRLLIALIESNQVEDNSICMPDALRPYLKEHVIKKDKRLPELKLVKAIKSAS